MPSSLFLLQLAATIFMTGVIWVIQVVHYPLFAQVGTEEFVRYASAHNTLIAPIVLPPMLLELATASRWLIDRPPNVPTWSAWLGFGLVALIWLSTFFLQVPQHSILASGFDSASHTMLVQSNWIRTAAWTLRSFLLLQLLMKM